MTQEQINKISQSNKNIYDKYLQSNIIKNRDVEKTTYAVYKANFYQFLLYLALYQDNIDIVSDEFVKNAVDIMEGYMAYCQNMGNHKKTVNNKIAAVSSFYLWATRRGMVPYHPFDKKLERIKGFENEHIRSNHFLTTEERERIITTLKTDPRYSIQDLLLFEIAYDSACRISALDQLKLSNLDMDRRVFKNVREKEGYIVDVPFTAETQKHLKWWLKVRGIKYDGLTTDAIFICRRNGGWKKIAKRTIYDKIKAYGTIVGIDDFHTHLIRKTRGNDIIKQTGNIQLAAALLNHKNINTTAKFYCKEDSKTEIIDKISSLMS